MIRRRAPLDPREDLSHRRRAPVEPPEALGLRKPQALGPRGLEHDLDRTELERRRLGEVALLQRHVARPDAVLAAEIADAHAARGRDELAVHRAHALVVQDERARRVAPDEHRIGADGDALFGARGDVDRPAAQLDVLGRGDGRSAHFGFFLVAPALRVGARVIVAVVSPSSPSSENRRGAGPPALREHAAPRVEHRLRRREAVVAAPRERPRDERRDRAGEGRARHLAQRGRVVVAFEGKHSHRVLLGEGESPRERSKHDRAERVKIRARVDEARVEPLLRRHVRERADRRVGGRERLGVVERLADAEVDELGDLAAAGAAQKDVVGRQIAVEDARGVRGAERPEYLLDNRTAVGEREHARAFQPLAQRLAHQPLAHDARPVPLLEVAVEARDVFALDPRHERRLALEHLQQVRPRERRAARRLHDDRGARPFFDGGPHLGHPAATEPLGESITAADDLAGVISSRRGALAW